MANDFKFTDNSAQVLAALKQAETRALNICGQKAVTYAQNLAREDTGLLRNSIAYALDGEAPNIKTYRANKGDGSGSYGGTMSKENGNARAVYVGTNVPYGIYNELGTRRIKAKPFIRPAAQDHGDEYKSIIESELKKG